METDPGTPWKAPAGLLAKSASAVLWVRPGTRCGELSALCSSCSYTRTRTHKTAVVARHSVQAAAVNQRRRQQQQPLLSATVRKGESKGKRGNVRPP